MTIQRMERVGIVISSAIALASATVAVAVGGGGAPVPNADGSRETVRQFLDRTWPEGAGGTVLAARHGELVACRGFGKADKRRGIDAGCNTVYDVMSMTKQFTAAAILKLEMMGSLRVSDPLTRFLGPVPADKEPITLHQLLTHSAGLLSSLGGDYERLSREEMITRALGSRLRSKPGAVYRYSNVGYSLLAAVVEEASGLPYERFLRKHVFRPAGMRQTGYVLPRWDPRRVAVEYDDRGRAQGKPFQHPWADDGPYWNLRGNGGMLSTAKDVFRWFVALRGDEVLSRAAKRKLFTPYVPETRSGETAYGYGWVIVDPQRYGRIAWHDGGNGWSYGLIATFLDRDGAIFWISNTAYRKGSWNLDRMGLELTLGIADRLGL